MSGFKTGLWNISIPSIDGTGIGTLEETFLQPHQMFFIRLVYFWIHKHRCQSHTRVSVPNLGADEDPVDGEEGAEDEGHGERAQHVPVEDVHADEVAHLAFAHHCTCNFISKGAQWRPHYFTFFLTLAPFKCARAFDSPRYTCGPFTISSDIEMSSPNITVQWVCNDNQRSSFLVAVDSYSEEHCSPEGGFSAPSTHSLHKGRKYFHDIHVYVCKFRFCECGSHACFEAKSKRAFHFTWVEMQKKLNCFFQSQSCPNYPIASLRLNLIKQ